MTNFGNFGQILIQFGGEVEFSVTNSIWEYGMPGVTFSHPNHPLHPPRNHLFLLFHDGITFERFELEGWNFMWGLIMEIFSKNEPMEKFRPAQPPQPPYPPPKQSRWDNFYNFRTILMRFCMEVTNVGIQLKWTDGITGPCVNHPTHPAHPPKNHLND